MANKPVKPSWLYVVAKHDPDGTIVPLSRMTEGNLEVAKTLAEDYAQQYPERDIIILEYKLSVRAKMRFDLTWSD